MYRLLIACTIVLISNYTVANEYLIFGGNASFDIATSVTNKLQKSVASAEIGNFNDGEISIKISENVRNKDVYIIQSIAKSDGRTVNDNLMELYLLIRTLKRASAGRITALIPYYGYARQDRKTESRVPISASDVAMLLENSGVDRIVAVDLHAGQIQGFFHNVPVDNIYGALFMAPKIAELKLKDPVIISPDAGGVTRAKKFRDVLASYGVEADLAVIVKERAKAGVVANANLIGNVEGRDAIIVDDICDTGGTLVKAAEELKKFGANKVYASITHPVFSKDAIEKIENSDFEKVYVSNSININKQKNSKIEQVSIATLLAMVIDNLDKGESLSTLFLPQNSYIEDYGVSGIFEANEIYPKFKSSKKIALDSFKSNVRVAVASTSQVKLDAVRGIFTNKLQAADNTITIEGFQCASEVSEQPIGIEEAIKGVKNRIKNLKKSPGYKHDEIDFIVAIENFFSKVAGNKNPTDHALVMIEDKNGKQYTYLSKGVEVNKDVANIALQGGKITVGEVLHKYYGVNDANWPAYVTAGKIDRQQQIISIF